MEKRDINNDEGIGKKGMTKTDDEVTTLHNLKLWFIECRMV